MFAKLRKFFCGPTPEEAYANGARLVDAELAKAADQAAEAEHLYAMASGGFNTTEAHRQFDRGVNDRLDALGFDCPY